MPRPTTTAFGQCHDQTLPLRELRYYCQVGRDVLKNLTCYYDIRSAKFKQLTDILWKRAVAPQKPGHSLSCLAKSYLREIHSHVIPNALFKKKLSEVPRTTPDFEHAVARLNKPCGESPERRPNRFLWPERVCR